MKNQQKNSIVSSENYNTADKGLFVGTKGVVGTFDLTKFATQQPDLIMTNGMAHKYVQV